ncbi:alpha/beta hydrolase family protein [Glycomyces salinus]|uniref:alpha/beta hydrolase family protein n=1 Tax=Glycomyces salinus TaxID=980294 RepID=UPI0018EE21CD|nr:alpha/beta fold hydrolase [Glycomyces salinus]
MDALDFSHRGRTLRGMMHLPDRTPAPAVVLCHGFGSSRMEFSNIFVGLARTLAERGLAAYRFDFAACGESDGEFADLTVSDQVDQAAAALETVAALPGVDAERISLMGMSLGGLTASLVAAKNPVRSLALWAPAAVAVSANELDEDPRWPDVLEHGYTDRGGTPIYRRFLEDGLGIDPWADAAYDGPVMLATGTDDELITDTVLQRYRDLYADRLEEHRFEGAGHTFETVPARERLLEATAEFLVRRT